jgi:hypothetical protein
MNHNTSLKLRRTIVLGIVVATGIAIPSAGAGNANGYERALPCQPTCDQGISGVPAVLDQASGATPAASRPVVEARGGLDWADAGIGAGIAFGCTLLLGGALLVMRRSGRNRLVAR